MTWFWLAVAVVIFVALGSEFDRSVFKDKRKTLNLMDPPLEGGRRFWSFLWAGVMSLSTRGKFYLVAVLLVSVLSTWGYLAYQHNEWEKEQQRIAAQEEREERQRQKKLAHENQQRSVTMEVAAQAAKGFASSAEVEPWIKAQRLVVNLSTEKWVAGGVTSPEVVEFLQGEHARLQLVEYEVQAEEFLSVDAHGSYLQSAIRDLEGVRNKIESKKLISRVDKRIEKLTKEHDSYRKEVQAEADRQAELRREAHQKQQRIKASAGTKPENSSWDGAVRPVTKYLKTNLKDPKSVEYIEWSEVVPLELDGEHYWVVRCKYRAKNSFGGYAIEEKYFFIQHGQVVSVE